MLSTKDMQPGGDPIQSGKLLSPRWHNSKILCTQHRMTI